MKKGLVASGVVLLVVAPLIVVMGTVYTLMLPNIYSSSATIAVTESQDLDPFSSGNGNYPAYNPYYLRTQFEILQSRPILNSVINRLNLQEKWGMDGTKLPREVSLQILQKSITVIQDRDTTLIRIIAKRDNPEEAAVIANELAETYRDYQLDEISKKKRTMLDRIDAAMKEQAQRVLDVEQRVSGVRQSYEFPANPEREESIELRKAKADLENERLIYDQLNKRMKQEIAMMGVPGNPVEIIDAAEPNRRPVSPNLFMNTICSVVVAGGVGLVGLVLLLVGLRRKGVPPPIPM